MVHVERMTLKGVSSKIGRAKKVRDNIVAKIFPTNDVLPSIIESANSMNNLSMIKTF